MCCGSLYKVESSSVRFPSHIVIGARGLQTQLGEEMLLLIPKAHKSNQIPQEAGYRPSESTYLLGLQQSIPLLAVKRITSLLTVKRQ